MRLLAIQELPQSKRVKLVFDDDTVLKTQPYLLADFGLYSGMELTEEDYQALLAAAGKASAKARAVRIVAAAGVSEKELQKRLVRKGEEAADAQEAVGWLKELHLLDDRETARQLAASAAAKGYGKSRIKNILFEKGIPQDLGEEALAELLRRLCKIDGLVWVRVHYLYPDEMSQELIDVLANEPKIVKYLDIPIQHINDEILRKMNRRGNGEYVRQLFTKLRHEIPGLVLRTSLITGLPGEGEAEFAQLCDFLKEYKLERVGAFAFSPEEGTRAAEMEYPDTEIAKQRAEQVAEIQSRIMDDYNESCVGQVMQVLCEGYDPDEDSYYGRTYADSPDIDGKIWFTAEKHIKTGDFVDIHVVDTYDGELAGVLEEEYNDDCE